MTNWQRTFALLYLNGESPLFQSSAIELSVPDRTQKLKLQCRAIETLDSAPLDAIIGASLPAFPTEKAGTQPTIFWTAPGEWLVVSGKLNLADISNRLAKALEGTLHALTDVSDSLVAIELRGSRATELLAEGCGIDLEDPRFGAGHYALTRLEQLPVIIHRTGSDHAYHVYVDRNTARYLWDWLKDGASLMA